MNRDDAPFEIHVHGDVDLRADVDAQTLQEALKPLWKYVGARSLDDGASSLYEEEAGIRFNTDRHQLQMCWTLAGDLDFRQQVDDVCMNLNEICTAGAVIEVMFYDVQFDDEDEDSERESRDDFLLLFVGPTPEAIMQAQRDLLVQDVVQLMERHFDGAELGGVVEEIDKLFVARLDALVSSLQINRPPRGGGSGPAGRGGRRPRHLH